VLHSALLTGESVRSLWNLSILSRWAGRLAGLCLALGRRGVSQRMKELRESLRNRPLDSSVKAPHFSMTPGRKKTLLGGLARQERSAR
jgi:hypothetical protein